ncbi:hypothetical protein [Shewanella surugensis]|uniref:Lipoprotein n=1 Tax=Shewanella surugensis TaxID=212020 RepID=A0ABT0LEA5_9GAMM|nr:hypothetical protein [Shewanella surugensis]MCL1125990.1 hypothetical protein [Shewanella surugensis]
MQFRFVIIFIKAVIVTAISSLLLSCEQQGQSDYSLPLDLSLCQFQGHDCQREVAGIEVNLDLSRPDAPSETAFDFSLSTSKRVDNVTMRLEGRDMYMGKIPVRLSAHEGQQFSGKMIYGHCSSGYMVWNVIVNFEYQGQSRSIIFPILADNQSR